MFRGYRFEESRKKKFCHAKEKLRMNSAIEKIRGKQSFPQNFKEKKVSIDKRLEQKQLSNESLRVVFLLYSQNLSIILNEVIKSIEKINRGFGYRFTFLTSTMKTKKIKVLRSPFVNKKSREKFNLKVSSIKIVIFMKKHKKNIEYVKYLLQYLNQKFDVALKIAIRENSSIGRV